MQDKGGQQADKAPQILTHLSRDLTSCNKVTSQLSGADIGGDTEVTILGQEKYITQGLEMNFLGSVLSNLSQLPGRAGSGRDWVHLQPQRPALSRQVS